MLIASEWGGVWLGLWYRLYIIILRTIASESSIWEEGLDTMARVVWRLHEFVYVVLFRSLFFREGRVSEQHDLTTSSGLVGQTLSSLSIVEEQ